MSVDTKAASYEWVDPDADYTKVVWKPSRLPISSSLAEGEMQIQIKNDEGVWMRHGVWAGPVMWLQAQKYARESGFVTETPIYEDKAIRDDLPPPTAMTTPQQ